MSCAGSCFLPGTQNLALNCVAWSSRCTGRDTREKPRRLAHIQQYNNQCRYVHIHRNRSVSGSTEKDPGVRAYA